MNIDLNIFKSARHMVENYLYSKNKQLRGLVEKYYEVPGFFPFKGAQTAENRQGIVEFKFSEFRQYEMFQRRISELNEQLLIQFNL
jgi:hypothetical protein